VPGSIQDFYHVGKPKSKAGQIREIEAQEIAARNLEISLVLMNSSIKNIQIGLQALHSFNKL
jgi:hypothetical protein